MNRKYLPHSPVRPGGLSLLTVLTGLALTLCAISSAQGGDTERRQAKRMHDRLTGVPPSEAIVQAPNLTILDLMENDMLGSGGAQAAALRALENPHFYTTTLKNFAMPWTNREQDKFAPLNDYTATVIGMVRDDIPFKEVLYGDIVYVGNPSLSGIPAFSMSNNDHYEALENQGVDLKANLVRRNQSDITDLPANATAGVLTSRAAAKSFFVAGTNRAMFRFTLMAHLCTDLEPLKDNSRATDRIRQDISRSPGGDSRLFMNSCSGCHTGMDPMAGAFAYYNYDEDLGKLVYTAGAVQPKHLINSDNFKSGYITIDDSWKNYWRQGPNGFLGWSSQSPNGSGNGAKSLGMELAQSDAFTRCQATKVYRSVCLSEPSQTQVTALVDTFDDEYKLKPVFAQAATQCMGN